MPTPPWDNRLLPRHLPGGFIANDAVNSFKPRGGDSFSNWPATVFMSFAASCETRGRSPRTREGAWIATAKLDLECQPRNRPKQCWPLLCVGVFACALIQGSDTKV